MSTDDENVREPSEGAEGSPARRSFLKLAGTAAVGGGATALLGASPAEAAGTVDGGTATTRDTAIQIRRGTKADWTAPNLSLRPGEVGVETDTGRIKVGPLVTGAATDTPWASSSYVDQHALDVASAQLDSRVIDDVNLDGITTASTIMGTEQVLGYLPKSTTAPAHPTRDVTVPIADLSTFHRADTVQLLPSVTADLVAGTTMVVGNGADPSVLRLPFVPHQAYPELSSAVSFTWRVRIVQTSLGTIEFTTVPNPPSPQQIILGSYALTEGVPHTRLKTKGKYAVAVAEAVLTIPAYALTTWVVSGDVVAF